MNVDATDTVTLDGTSSTASSSSIVNFVQGVGTAGNIFINTGSLNIIGNALIGSVTQGQGDAGSVTIRALDAVSLSGTNSSILSTVKDSGIGNGGDINIQARSLSLSDRAQVATSTLGTGNAGNIQINTLDNISINNGSLVRADTFSNGNAGNIAIQAGGAVSFDGIGSFGVTSGVFTLVGWDERKTLIGQPYTKSSVRAQQCCAPTNDELGAFLLRLLTRFKGNQTDQPQQECLGCPFLSKEK